MNNKVSETEMDAFKSVQLLTVLSMLLMVVRARVTPVFVGECYGSRSGCFLDSAQNPARNRQTCYERYIFNAADAKIYPAH